MQEVQLNIYVPEIFKEFMLELKKNGVQKIKMDKVVYEQIKKDDPFNTSGVRDCVNFKYILGMKVEVEE